jgi:hypothetical protein
MVASEISAFLRKVVHPDLSSGNRGNVYSECESYGGGELGVGSAPSQLLSVVLVVLVEGMEAR